VLTISKESQAGKIMASSGILHHYRGHCKGMTKALWCLGLLKYVVSVSTRVRSRSCEQGRCWYTSRLCSCMRRRRLGTVTVERATMTK
jgi:hypothetical protein